MRKYDIEKDLFTNKKIKDMTNSEIESSTLKYEKEIIIKQNNILDTLKSTKELSNAIGNELNSNTESLDRINDDLDSLEHKLKTSEYLVKKFSSWFSYFIPVKYPESHKKHAKEIKYTTKSKGIKFEESDPEKKVNDLLNKNNKNNNKENNETKINTNDFYDSVSLYLDDLQKDSETFGKILREQKEIIDTIEEKTERSEGKIKKTIHKVKHC